MTMENLRNLRSCDVPMFSMEGLTVLAKVVEIYDGDTFKAIFHFPFPKNNDDNDDDKHNNIVKMTCRVHGVDAPEMKPLKTLPNRTEHIRKAHLARQRLCQLLTDSPQNLDDNKKLIHLHFKGTDKYGRCLVECENVKTIMIAEGLCTAYDGGKKRKSQNHVKLVVT